MNVVQKQIDDHANGIKTVGTNKLESMRRRVAQYAFELTEWTRPLLPEVCNTFIKLKQKYIRPFLPS